MIVLSVRYNNLTVYVGLIYKLCLQFFNKIVIYRLLYYCAYCTHAHTRTHTHTYTHTRARAERERERESPRLFKNEFFNILRPNRVRIFLDLSVFKKFL